MLMEVAVELEDDLFFADLSKQISQLIMDEDEDPLPTCPPDSLQVFHYFHLNLLKHTTHASFFLFRFCLDEFLDKYL